MSSISQEINGLTLINLAELWEELGSAPVEARLVKALELTGCEFHDSDHSFVSRPAVALAAIGGIAVMRPSERKEDTKARLYNILHDTEETMGNSAAFSYLNSGNRSPRELYLQAVSLGHFSIAHTVQANFLVAGISEAVELELSLQRDLVHLSKLTNTRTRVQNRPPLVVKSRESVQSVKQLYEHILQTTTKLRTSQDAKELEDINGLFPVNKATILMLSGDLSNFRKLVTLRLDTGKEDELRSLLTMINDQLGLLWPDIFKEEVE